MMFVLALTFCCSSFYRKFLHKDESSTWSTYFPSTTMPSITKGRNPNLSANVNSASEYYLSFCEFSFIKNNAVTVNGANIIMLISDSTFFNCSKLITSSSENHIYGCILSFNGTQSSKFQQVRVCASLCRFILENNSLYITNPDRSYTVSNISNSFYSDIFPIVSCNTDISNPLLQKKVPAVNSQHSTAVETFTLALEPLTCVHTTHFSKKTI